MKQCIFVLMMALSVIAEVPSKFYVISTHREGRTIYYNGTETKQMYSNFKAHCTVANDFCRVTRINSDTKTPFAGGVESFAVQKDKDNPNVVEIERNDLGCAYKYILNFKTKRFIGGSFYCRSNIVEGVTVIFITEKGIIGF